MSSLKVILCDLCILLVMGLNFTTAEEAPRVNKTEGPAGNCSCGGFNSDKPEAGAAPVISQMPGLTVKEDADGEATCKALCIALATATKAKGPEILCNRLKAADELKLSAFFKVGSRPWVYAGMTAEAPLCCEASKVKLCASAIALNATTVGVTGPPPAYTQLVDTTSTS